jgi:hypothetical protein
MKVRKPDLPYEKEETEALIAANRQIVLRREAMVKSRPDDRR